jgi:hypothetical protein
MSSRGLLELPHTSHRRQLELNDSKRHASKAFASNEQQQQQQQ